MWFDIQSADRIKLPINNMVFNKIIIQKVRDQDFSIEKQHKEILLTLDAS